MAVFRMVFSFCAETLTLAASITVPFDTRDRELDCEIPNETEKLLASPWEGTKVMTFNVLVAPEAI